MKKQRTVKLDIDTADKLTEIKRSTGNTIAETVRKLVSREYERLKKRGVIEKGS